MAPGSHKRRCAGATVITQDSLVDKTMSNIKEVARGAVVIAICKENLQEDCQECDEIL